MSNNEDATNMKLAIKRELMPKLRFPEFRDAGEWDIKPLEKICEIKGGKRIPKGFSLTNKKTDYPYVRVSDMYMGGIDTSSVLYIPSEIEKQIRNYKISKHDLFITVAGTIGIVGEVPEELDNANLTENANKIVVKSIVKRYLLNYLTSEAAQKHISSSVTNNAQPKLALERIRLFPIPVPFKKEQQKIADCLSSIDELITAQTKKLNTLKTHKKGLMQQLIPAEGETQPKLRFPEFRDDWVIAKLGELGKLSGGGTPDKSVVEYWQGDIPWVSSSDIFEDDIYTMSVTRFINEKSISESATKLVPKGSVLFVSRVGTGKLAVNDKDVCTSQDFTNFLPKKIYNYFLGYFFIANKSALISLGQGTSIKGFSKGDLEQFEVSFPSSLEQKKIADCLSSIDDLIVAQTQKLVTLKTHKKAMMQQLFPAIEEVQR